MKEYEKLPEELKNERETGILLEETIFDDGYINGNFHNEKKQYSTLVQTHSGKYIVSWFLGDGDEEWNHVYDSSEKHKAFNDFKSIVMEEDYEIVDEAKENAFNILEKIYNQDPEIIQASLNPLLQAFYQNNLEIKRQAIDVIILLANKDINLIKFMINPIMQRYKHEDPQIKKKLLLLCGEIGVKEPLIFKKIINLWIEDLLSGDASMKIIIMSTLNKIGRVNTELLKEAIPALKKLCHSQNLSVRHLAKKLLENI
ncbi:MAG: HEAT repeat domain-containing protein [Promethearchaeota archaeon]